MSFFTVGEDECRAWSIPPRHDRAGRGRRNPQRHRARVHPRRGGRLRRLHRQRRLRRAGAPSGELRLAARRTTSVQDASRPGHHLGHGHRPPGEPWLIRPRSASSFPRSTKAAASAQVVTALRAAAPWREVLVVDDGSTDGTAGRPRRPGARVVTHPYNKGNGAAVKTGIRAALGDWILIADGDGQHRAGRRARASPRGSATTTSSSARATGRTQASHGRRARQRPAQPPRLLPGRARRFRT